MRRYYRLGEVEDVLADMDLSEVDDDIAEVEGDKQLVISGWFVLIPELKLRLHAGVVGYWDEKLQGYMPDFTVTVVVEKDPAEEEYIYYKQDGMVLTMANWLHGRFTMEEIEALRCEIVIPSNRNI